MASQAAGHPVDLRAAESKFQQMAGHPEALNGFIERLLGVMENMAKHGNKLPEFEQRLRNLERATQRMQLDVR